MILYIFKNKKYLIAVLKESEKKEMKLILILYLT